MKQVLALLLFLGAVLLSQGCAEKKDRDDSKVPWGRPASWENQMPGMGAGF